MSVGKHTAYNLFGALLPLALSLVTIPIYIRLIGESRYGVLSVAFLLLGYFGLFDLGLGAATAQRIAAIGEDSHADRASTFWTAVAMNFGLGCAGGLLIWPVALYFFGHVFNVEPSLRGEMHAAIPWLALALPLATLSGVLTGALQGRSRFLELNVVSIFSSALTQVVPLTVAWMFGADLALLLPAVVVTRVIAIAILFLRCRVHVFRGQSVGFSPGHAKSLLHFGGWVTVSALVSPLMTMLDRFVIGATLGAKSVTHYAVPFQLVEKTAVVPAALTSALFPRLAANPPAEARLLAIEAMRVLTSLMTPIVVAGLYFIGPFLRWWLNPSLAAFATLPAQILLLGFWINAFARVPYVSLLAEGRPDVVAKSHLSELLAYFLALYVGLHFWGLPGAAAAFGMRTVLDWGLLMHFAGMLRDGLGLLWVPALLVVGSFGMVMVFSAHEQIYWAAAVGMLLLTACWAWVNAPQELRRLVAAPTRLLRN